MPRYKPLKGFPGLKKPASLENADAVNKRVKRVLAASVKRKKPKKL